MKLRMSVGLFTMLLASIAGFCDAATFVAADQLFSAHVTGNFIVFAYEMVKGSYPGAWVKLGTFPVFVLSVITGGWVVTKTENRYMLLLVEGLLLLVSGIVSYWLKLQCVDHQESIIYIVVMLIVFAMGLQNTFGKIFSKETHGPTTMMTGNVTQASIDLGGIIRSKLRDATVVQSLKRQLITIGGFLIGCLTGAIMGKYIGLGSVILPGLVMMICYINMQTNFTGSERI